MSFLGNLFSDRKGHERSPTPSEAIQRLADVEEMLGKKQLFLEKKIGDELKIAKKNGTRNKRAALEALRRKRRYEKQLSQIDGTLTTIEYQRGALEEANTNTEIIKAMGYGAKALEKAQKLSIDEVHDMLDEIQEQQQIANEVAEAISRPFSIFGDIDEEELMEELEALEEKDLTEKLLNVDDKMKNLPIPPEDELRPRDQLEEDEDMSELKNWMLQTA